MHKKAKIIKNGNVNLSNIELEKVAAKINGKLGDVLDLTDDLIKKLEQKPDFEKYYHDIEMAIISWSNDGTKTAGTLTRKIMNILSKKK